MTGLPGLRSTSELTNCTDRCNVFGNELLKPKGWCRLAHTRRRSGWRLVSVSASAAVFNSPKLRAEWCAATYLCRCYLLILSFPLSLPLLSGTGPPFHSSASCFSCIHFHTARPLLFNHYTSLFAPLFHSSRLFSSSCSSGECEACASLWGCSYNKRAWRMPWRWWDEWEVKYGINITH